MPKILRIVNRFNLGGPTYNAAYLSRYLPDDYQTVLVGGRREADEDSSEFILQDLGLQYTILPELQRSLNFRNDRKVYQQLVELIRKEQPDIVHTHASKAGALGRLAAFKCGVPVVVHTFHGHVFHSYFGHFKTSIYKNVERRLAAKSSAVIAISPLQHKELTQEFRISDPAKTKVIPLGFDLERFSPADTSLRTRVRSSYGIDDDAIVIGIIGRFAPIKNHRLFIEAFAHLRSDSPQKVTGLLAGDGELRGEMMELAASRGLTISTPESPVAGADLVFCSWVRNIPDLLHGLDMVVLSSFNEGTPVSLIEAQAAQLPVISSRVGGVGDVVRENETGFLFPSGEAQALSHAMRKLVESSEMRLQMGMAGRKFSLDNFHYSRMVAEHDALYRELLSK